MKKYVVILICVLLASLLAASCCKQQKCKPTVRVSYIVPEFVCPVPSDPALKAITPEIVADDLQFKKVMGDNLVMMQQTLAMWRGVYYECVQSIIKLYKNESEKVNAENADIEDNALLVPDN